jgi:hypothetical protein
MYTGRLAGVICLIGLPLLILRCSELAVGQTLGTVTMKASTSCSPLIQSRGFDQNMTSCYQADLSGCPGDDDLPFVYGVEEPSGTPSGTIVMLAGMGGGMGSDTPSLLS